MSLPHPAPAPAGTWPAAGPGQPDRTAVLAGAFFCSGFAALLCQIVWQSMLGIFAGSDTVSAALAVGAFLGGLGLGSLIGARIADRLSPRAALVGFVLAELGVAAFVLVSRLFLYDVLAVDLAGVVDASAAIFALCFAGLVLPTTLMGVSLSLLTRAVTDSLDTAAERIGRLNALNTLGAGLGALLGSWLVVGSLGLQGALFLAAGLDLAAALLAATLLPGLRGGAARHVAVPVAGRAPFGALPLWCLLVFLSGYVIVALEIVWLRLMGQVGQYHAYLFPTVLGVFLLADGLGMAVAARMVGRLRDPRPAFFVVQSAGLAPAAAIMLVLWWALPHPRLRDLVSVDLQRLRGEGMAASMVLTVLVVAPPSFLIGMTFPLVQRAVQQDLASVGARVGWVQLANIFGNAAGSIGTGLVSLHLLGTTGTLKLLAALSLLLLLAWLWTQRFRRVPEATLAALCAILLVAMPGNAAFWSRAHGAGAGAGVARAEDRSGIVLFRQDGAPGAAPDGPFFIQGYAQGRIPFMPIHLFLGAVGPLLHPDPARVLCIGIGSGGTPWAAGISPATREVHVIELVSPVLGTLGAVAERAPEGPVARMLRDPRWRVERGDGRRALAGGGPLYDVIQADAILPESSQSGLLYSREFLKQVRRRLAPGGLYVQWGPTPRSVETFAAVFPHTLLLMPASVLVGSDAPIRFDAEELRRRIAGPVAAAHLAAGQSSPPDLRPFFADPPLAWAPGTPRAPASLTDLFPRDEFHLNNGTGQTLGLRAPAR